MAPGVYEEQPYLGICLSFSDPQRYAAPQTKQKAVYSKKNASAGVLEGTRAV